jgi:hypothetical protein
MALIIKAMNKFKSSYENAQEAPTLKLFLHNVFDFFSAWDADTQLGPINQAIIDKTVKDHQPSKDAKEAALHYFDAIWTELGAYQNEHGLEKIPLTFFEQASYFEKENPVYSTGDIVLSTHQVLISRLTTLVEKSPNHIPFVAKFATIACSATREIYTIGNRSCYDRALLNITLKNDVISPYLIAQEKLKNINPTAIWNHWSTLAWLHRARVGDHDNLSPLETGDVIVLAKQINGILATNENTTHLFGCDLNDLKYSLRKIFEYVSTFSKNPKSISKNAYVRESKTQISVHYNNKPPVSFRLADSTGKYVRTFAKNAFQHLTDQALWAKMHNTTVEMLGGKEEEQLNETRKSVNKGLKKIGMNDAFKKTKKSSDKLSPQIIEHWPNQKYKFAKQQ